jgi:signal transduction histidine kinase/CheY-like chemotaxis protein
MSSYENIFESWLTLKLKDKFYESAYQAKRYQKLKKYNIIMSSILCGISLILTVIFILKLSSLFDEYSSKYVTLQHFTTTFIVSINLLLSIFIKSKRIQGWITYVNYVFIMLVFANLRFYFVFVLHVDLIVFTLMYSVETFFRKAWFFLGMIDFIPGVYLQIITIVVNYILFFGIIPLQLQFRFSVNACILMISTCIMYFLIREQKRSFYYYLSMKSKYDWFKNVIDNMNSGFISVENQKIQYFNYTMVKLLTHDNIIQETDERSRSISLSLDDIFSNIRSEAYSMDGFKSVIQILLQNYSISGSNFFFLGTKDIETSTRSIINLEIHGRCYSSNHSEVDKYEFIFNDITRSKQIEEKNAEFKYKNLFLSKIAHEFKNPLLCICELVDQLSEENNVAAQKLKGILKQIKSMSNYLIILVKDFDYFSQKNSGVIKAPEISYINIEEIINFCNDIATALIKKLQKGDYIKFEIIKGPNVPKRIYSDDNLLKQILVNLLSNSTKYTQSGTITLLISVIEDRIRFTVRDTGKGISEQQKEKLFVPFSNEFDKLNKVSSGLGLSIVKDLTDLLGSKIEFDSNIGEGSSFWFEIPLRDCVDPDYKSISEVTVEGIQFNEQEISDLLHRDISECEIKIKISQKEVLIIVVDDEIVTRQSAVRLLSKYLKEKSYEPTIIEASDGIECLYKYLVLYREGKKIDFILSDETMEFMNGMVSAEILWNLYGVKNLVPVPFFILSAYGNLVKQPGVNDVFTKPLRKQNIDDIMRIVSV